MDKERLDTIRTRLKAITPGEWRRGIGSEYREVTSNAGGLIAIVYGGHNCNFIADAPEDMRALLDYIEELEARVEYLEIGDEN